MKWLIERLKILWLGLPKVYLLLVTISVAVGFITTVEIGILTFFGLSALFIGYIWVRQLYWWITSNEKNNSQEGKS